MSVTRQKGGEIVYLCDGPKCHESFETGENAFFEAVKILKQEDPKWRIAKHSNGEWHHYCPDCKEWSYRDASYDR